MEAVDGDTANNGHRGIAGFCNPFYSLIIRLWVFWF
jgi:hypothetical protein